MERHFWYFPFRGRIRLKRTPRHSCSHGLWKCKYRENWNYSSDPHTGPHRQAQRPKPLHSGFARVNNLGPCKPIVWLMSWIFFLPPSTFPSLTRQTEPLDLRLTQSSQSGKKPPAQQILLSIYQTQFNSAPGETLIPGQADLLSPSSLFTCGADTEEEQNWTEGTASKMAKTPQRGGQRRRKCTKQLHYFFLQVFLCKSRQEADCNFLKTYFTKEKEMGFCHIL